MSPNPPPNLETLFGPVPFCECEDCQSVLSPAAYLVDLLHTILETKISATASGQTHYGVELLKAWPGQGGHPVDRRPDIVRLELSCDNTNIRVPTIDLGNEILENAIVAGTPQTMTLGTEEELGANPQYVNEAAYDEKALAANVANAVYPWTLPFDLWGAEGRVYLEQLGVPRHELMAALRKRAPGEAFEEQEGKVLIDDAIVAERLGLSPLERDVITGTVPAAPGGQWRCWGFGDLNQNDWVNRVAALPLRSPGGRLGGFLGRAGLEYDDLLDLLPTRFMNPRGAADPHAIDFDSADCNLEQTHLKNLTAHPQALARLHRFVRLKRKLGWTFLELDQAATALKGAVLDGPFLVRVSHVEMLRKRFGLPLDELLSWWSSIDTQGDRERKNSLYERVFQNKSIRQMTSPKPDPFELNKPAPDELLHPDPNVIPADVVPAVLAAVGLTAPDFELLKPNALNLEGLSRIYRIASFARALDLSIPDYLSLRALLSDPAQSAALDPFDPAHTEHAVRFVDEVDRIRRAGFKPFELDYVLRDLATPIGGLVPPGEHLLKLLEDVRNGLNRIGDFPAAPDDSRGEATHKKLSTYLNPDKKLSTYLNPDIVEDAFAVVSGTSTKSAADQTKLVKDAFDFLGAANAATLAAALVPGPADPPKRFAVCLGPILEFEWRTARVSLVLAKLKSAFAVDPLTKKLDAGAVEKLFTGGETGTGAVPSGLDPLAPAIADFLPDDPDRADWSEGLDLIRGAARTPDQDLRDVVNDLVNKQGKPVANFIRLGAQVRTLILARKIATCLGRLGATTEEIPLVLKDGMRAGWPGWLDPNDFQGTKPSYTAYTAFRRLLDLFALRGALPSGVAFGVIARVDAKLTAAEIQTFLSERTRWPLEDVTELAGAGVLDFSGSEWSNERGLGRLLSGMSAARRLGVSVSRALTWCQSPLGPEQSREIKSALKAKTGEDDWLARTKPLQDRLRERRRDALVSFHLGNPGRGGLPAFRDENAIFHYFLFDTQVSACQTVSRMSYAIGAVQLFIQHCLMGLVEYPDGNASVPVLVNPDGARWWPWMSTFQLSVAAKQVWLHPESYVHGWLRDDKSPFFKELENQLLQGDHTPDSAEDAYRAYFEKLVEVARPEIGSMFHEAAADGKPDVLHVLGRTWGTPPRYFYRKRSMQVDGPEWSPWEKVNLDLPGQPFLFVWNRRLHIFCPIFTERAEPPDDGNINTPPKKHWEIQLAWSEYRKGKWSHKQISRGPGVESSWLAPLQPAQFFFEPEIKNDKGLEIRCLYSFETYEWISRFESSCNGTIEAVKLPPIAHDSFLAGLQHGDFSASSRKLILPVGSENQNMMFAQTDLSSGLTLINSDPATDESTELVLGNSPTPYRLLPSHQFNQFISQDSFFYQDQRRTFLVEPERRPTIMWHQPAKVSPVVFLHPQLAAAAMVERPVVVRAPIDAMVRVMP